MMSLTEQLHTYENIQSFKDNLKSLIAGLEGRHAPNLKDVINENFSEWQDLFLSQLGSRGADINDINSIVKISKEMLGELDRSDYVEITMSFDPDPDFRSRLASWVSQNVGENVSIIIKTDPELGGGILVSFRGKFKDLSIKKKLQNYFSKNGTE